MKLKYLLSLLADWANGIFATALAAFVTNTDILWWYFFVGLLLSHFPDLDAIPELIKRGKVAASANYAFDHRDGLHYPLLLIMISLGLALSFGFWGYLLLFSIALHFLNDFYGTGWGIKILWPFSKLNYKLLGRRVNRLKSDLEATGDWGELEDEERRLRLIVCWKPAELPAYMQRWGIEDWIDKYYLRLNVVSITEYTLFVLALLLAFWLLLK